MTGKRKVCCVVMLGRALFIANSLDNAFKFRKVLAELGVEASAGSVAQIRRLLGPGADFDMVIFEVLGPVRDSLREVVALVESCRCALLVIVDDEGLDSLQLPSGVPCDFVMRDAKPAECLLRVKQLLGEGAACDADELIAEEGMVINLATYQVTVAGEPVDFTYLEYSLLKYLVQHPNRTFTRDSLLQNIWGFDYYGGSRTVDVHVRRIRAKLGPNLAQHLETVRGVGYLWNPQKS